MDELESIIVTFCTQIAYSCVVYGLFIIYSLVVYKKVCFKVKAEKFVVLVEYSFGSFMKDSEWYKMAKYSIVSFSE